MQVTIEGVVSTDVCGRGDRHTVEWTEHLRQLVRRGLVQVVEWHHPERYAEGGVPPEPVAMVADREEPVLSSEVTEAVVKSSKRRRRKTDDTTEE